MPLTIGDTAPDFEAETSEGPIRFYDWLGDSWGVLFSHPKDFTPICTTELGYMAKIKPEFDLRGVKIIGLSVDSTGDHERWAADIAETQGTAPNYPLIADQDFKVAKLFGALLQTSTEGTRIETHTASAGLRVPAGPGAVMAEWARTRRDAAALTVRNTGSVGYDYFLSKRTNLYTVYGHVANNAAGRYGFASVFVTPAQGASSSGLALGIRHLF